MKKVLYFKNTILFGLAMILVLSLVACTRIPIKDGDLDEMPDGPTESQFETLYDYIQWNVEEYGLHFVYKDYGGDLGIWIDEIEHVVPSGNQFIVLYSTINDVKYSNPADNINMGTNDDEWMFYKASYGVSSMPFYDDVKYLFKLNNQNDPHYIL